MKLFFLTFLAFFNLALLSAQENTSVPDSIPPCVERNHPPNFYSPNCDYSMYQSELSKCSNREMMLFIKEHLVYPEQAKKKGIGGVVVVRIIILQDGSVSEDGVTIVRGLGYGCDEEAIRVVKLMKWMPACNQGATIDFETGFNIPIRFRDK